MRAVEDLPFEPTTWIEAKRRCGIPSTVISLCMRSSPNRIPNSSRSRRYASACSGVTASTQLGQFAAVALELRALAVHDGRRRLRHELLVRKLRLRARDLAL